MFMCMLKQQCRILQWHNGQFIRHSLCCYVCVRSLRHANQFANFNFAFPSKKKMLQCFLTARGFSCFLLLCRYSLDLNGFNVLCSRSINDFLLAGITALNFSKLRHSDRFSHNSNDIVANNPESVRKKCTSC